MKTSQGKKVPPKLSIVTVVLNDPVGLKKTIESVKALRFKDYEYIVVDGGSNDETLDLIKAEPAISSWVSETDNGVYNAMNKGINMSQGNYVHLLNAGDTYYSPLVLNELHFETKKPFLAWSVLKRGNKDIIWHPHKSKLYNSMRIAHPGLIVNRSFYENNRFYSENFSIMSDALFILENVTERNCALHDELLVDMDEAGLSSSLSWQHIYERHSLINKYQISKFVKILLHLRTFLFILQKALQK